jgi:hypothetical protein
MNKNKEPLYTVSMFLGRFYHEEPNDTLALTKAVRAMTGLFEYEWEVAQAFEKVLQNSYPNGTLKQMVKEWANRRAKDDEQAKMFLKYVYEDTTLDVAIDPALLTE